MSGTFYGGVHPDDAKSLSNSCAIEEIPLPSEVVLPVSQHIGAPASVIVQKGDDVRKGQVIAEAGGFVSVPVHATVSGTVKVIEPKFSPLGMEVMSVVIESDGKDTWVDGLDDENQDISSMSSEEMRNAIRDAGIVGMGGAAFPTHVKLSPPDEKSIDSVILNGVECEPYASCDHRLMLERTNDIVEGLKIIMKILGCSKGYIGIERNKPDAIKTMRDAVKDVQGVKVEELKVKYPQGGEKQLIYSVLKRKVPAGGLPMDVGCVVQNVGTSIAIFNAVKRRIPLISRVVTVTGNGVNHSKNLNVRLGTLFSDLIEYAGGYTENASKLINGGPMMGISQFTDVVPVIKGTSCILVMEENQIDMGVQFPCISCARCVDVCPMKLVPTKIASLVEFEIWDDLKKFGALDCIDCGSCSYICPSKRKLLEYIKFGKAKLAEMRAQELARKHAAEKKLKAASEA